MQGLSTTDRDQLDATTASWHDAGLPSPAVWMVAGSGLSSDLGLGDPAAEIALADLLPFPVRSVVGHPHKLVVYADSARGPIVHQQGRLHLYQGYSAAEVAFTVRLGARLGARTLLMSNAAGSLRAEWGPGTLVAISDHLNLTGRSPLLGEVPESWGPQFPDMTTAYDPDLLQMARSHAEMLDLELPDGVYAGLLGPSYETPAEVRMVANMGGDLVGMSTVTEVIAARHMGLRCLCFSLVANAGAGMSGEALDHQDVLDAAAETGARFARLLASLLSDPALTASAGDNV